MRDGPLDMRMNPERVPASDWINAATEIEIADLSMNLETSVSLDVLLEES